MIAKPVSYEECRRVLKSLPSFSLLRDDDIEALKPLVRARDFVAGATVFYEDDETDAVYFIANGSVEVFKSDPDGRKLPLTILRDGGVFGEVGLLIDVPRTATVRTLTPVRLLFLSTQKFRQALAEDSLAAHRLALAFAHILAQRLGDTDEKLLDLFAAGAPRSAAPKTPDLPQSQACAWTM